MKFVSHNVLGLLIAGSLASCASDFRPSPHPSDRSNYDRRLASERRLPPRYDDRASHGSYYQEPRDNERRVRLQREASRLRAELAEQRDRHAGTRDVWTRRERERYENLQEQLARIEREMAAEDRRYGLERRPFDEYFNRPFAY